MSKIRHFNFNLFYLSFIYCWKLIFCYLSINKKSTFSKIIILTVFMRRFLRFSDNSKAVVLLCLIVTCLATGDPLNQRMLQDDKIPVASTPDSYDWRDVTTITPVKNQLTCNAYYAFSTIAFFQQDLILNEGASKDIDLSQQYLTSCLPTGGCVGGAPKDAMQLVLKKGGIPQQKPYPFKPYQLQPEDICYPQTVVKIGDRPMFGFFNLEDQQFLKQMILRQPLNIYICSQDLKTYGPKSNSDRMLSCSKDNTYPDHTVLLIGYTQTQWIIKNSWGTDWGLAGFGYISRNPDNDCCIGHQILLRGKKSATCNVQNCQVCVQNNYCSKCKPGYFVSYKNNVHTCVQCNYQNCAQCQNNVGYCKTCIYGYALYFPQQVCKKSIIQNCQSIVNGGCKKCHDGYRVNAKFLCQNDCSIKNCDTCKDDKSCSKCKSGFVLTFSNGSLICKQNTCNKIQHCATCNSQGKCLSCVGSFSLIQDSCIMKCEKPNCLECSQTQNICSKCVQGYAKDYYSHECVATSVANCLVSYLAKYCSICFDGYQRTDSWQKCIKTCNIDNCKTCQLGISNKCNFCQEGYTLKVPSGQTIAICQKNPCDYPECSLCDASGSSCVKCIDKYHIWSAESKSCIPYKCTIDNCKTCKTDSKACQVCNDGMVLYIPTGVCMKSNFQHCVGMGLSIMGLQCWDCDAGYQIDYTTWKNCKRICSDENCIDCSDSATFCKTCQSGYFIKNISDTQNRCGKFPVYLPNCLRGNSDQTVCYQCKQFYHFNNQTQSCQLNDNCPKDCVKCTDQNADTLKCQCKSGLAWDFINSQCIMNPSDAQCLVVSNYTGNSQCFQCKDGFTLTADGKGCQPNCKVQKCDICVHSTTSNYPDYCQQCIQGYISANNLTRCLKCNVQFCKSCKSATQLGVCTQCKIGYELKSNGASCQQIPCPSDSKFNGVQCMCLSGYFKDAEQKSCNACGAGCKRCSSAETCLQCSSGFYLDNKKCSTCFQNCQSCKDGKSCSNCLQGYTYQMIKGVNSCARIGLGREGYFVLANGKKAKCSPGCASCAQDKLVCQQCLAGYILTNSSTCLKCAQNCRTCYPHILGACKTCQIGYVLIDAQCIKCSSQQCIQCPVKAEICTSCLAGFYVKNQTCHSCGLGCQQCDSDGVCTQCHTGFVLSYNNVCDQCLDGCSKCNQATLQICDQGCLDGTYLKVDTKNSSLSKCTPCPSICKTCQSASKCSSCIQGYDLVNDVCQKWCTDRNCFSCKSDSKTCLQCYAGYVIQGGSCVADITCSGIDQPTTDQTNNTDSTTNNETNSNNSTSNETSTNQTTNDNTTNTNETTDNTTDTTNSTTDNTNSTTNNTNTNQTTDNQTNNNGTLEPINGSGAQGDNTTTNSNSTNTNETTKNSTTDSNSTTPIPSGQCQVCPKQYYLNAKFACQKCQTTDQNCISCTNNNPALCTQCAQNYYIDQNSTCTKCSQNCQTCRSPNYCYVCSKGYYMLENSNQYSGNCVKCDSNCQTCVDHPKNCLSCKAGYTLSVAKICMNTDLMKFKLKLDMPFQRYSRNARAIKKDFINFFSSQTYIFIIQYSSITQGSTILEGYISIPQNEANKNQTYQKLTKNFKGGDRLGGYDVMEIALTYNDKSYFSSSNKRPDDDNGPKGWVIAVAVVGGVIGFIILMVIICMIAKKIRSNNDQKETDQQDGNIQISGKNTEANLKKQNPEIRI